MSIVVEGIDNTAEMGVQPIVVAPANSNLTSDIEQQQEDEQPSDTDKHDSTPSLPRTEQDPSAVTSDVDTPLSFRLREVFVNFAPLGLVAFGGPTAHVAILHERFVESKKWLDDEKFIELLAVGQGLPGPTSTQMVIATGTARAGPLGGLIAFMCWNVPSFIVLVVAGLSSRAFLDPDGALPYWMSGLPAAAVSLVFVAASKLGTKICTTKLKMALTLASAMLTLWLTGDARIDQRWASLAFPAFLIIGGLVTLADSRREGKLAQYFNVNASYDDDESIYRRIGIPVWAGIFFLVLWLTVLVTVILLRNFEIVDSELFLLFETFWRIGSIIYGGGQVVLPMLLTEVVSPGFVSESQFFQGFALVQALPGPLFNFSSFLGAVAQGFVGAVVCWVGLFGPGLLLIFAFLPFWMKVRRVQWFKCFLAGVNATAIGLIFAACVSLWEKAVDNNAQASAFMLTGALVGAFKVPAPIAIVLGGLVGFLLSPGVGPEGLAQTPFCPATLVFENGTVI